MKAYVVDSAAVRSNLQILKVRAVLSYLYLLELDNGYTQDFSAASAEYIPEFDLEGL